MGLRELAAADMAMIMQDADYGFAWPISIIDPDGQTVPDLVGFSNDIAQSIDPDTGELISGRLASAVLVLATLQAAGLTIPRGIADSSVKPWVIQFDDINGHCHTFKVRQANPDRTLGIVSCILEGYDQ